MIAPGSTLICQSASWLLSRLENICTSGLSDNAVLSGEGDMEAIEQLVDYGRFKDAFEKFRRIEYAATADAVPAAHYDTRMDFDCSPQALFHKNFQLIAETFTRLLSDGYKLLILSDSPHQAQRLRDIFSERGDNIDFTPVENTIHCGFADNEKKICYFTDHQIFDRYHKYSLRSDRARSGKVALSLKELGQIEPGDYIVHSDHGIGRFVLIFFGFNLV